MKKLFYPLMLATVFVATSCTNTEDTNTPVDPSGKTPISFVGENNTAAMTRAGFTYDTEVVMHIRSVSKKGDKTLETLTFANAEEPVSGASFSNVAFTQAGDYRYWDDAHGRDSKLSVFAIAVPNKSSVKNADKYLKALLDGNETWADKGVTEDVKWTVSATQTDDILNNEDLVYSNNIQADETLGIGGVNSSNSTVTNGELQFRLTDTSANADSNGPGKFDEGRLNFTHALSRITVNLTKSDGFTENSKFEFTSANGNVSIPGVPTSGTLNLETGTWTQDEPTTGINSMSVQSSSADKHSLMAQMLPGYEIRKAGTSANMLSFEIDNNQYFVTQAQMYEALTKASEDDRKKITIGENSIVMQQSINYIFNINVKKTGVVVTATVADFNKVTAEEVNPSNARIHLNLLSGSNTPSGDGTFKIVRALEESPSVSDSYVGTNWLGDYKETATLTANGSSWNTDWFFDSNKAYYHFRLVNKESTIEGTNDKDVVDYFKISSGSTDFHWGAPMDNTKGDVVYNVESGYENNLYQAIGATTDAIGIVDLHVMSKIIVVLQSSGDGAVDLTRSTVKLTKVSKDGTVLVGTGKVIPSSATTSIVDELQIDMSGFYVVPQTLVRGTAPSTEYVGITIETGNGNKYVIDNLSTIKATSVDNEKNQTKGTEITRWYPGHEYTYTFNLKKTGIGSITCTVVGWNEVKAEPTNISLEN